MTKKRDLELALFSAKEEAQIAREEQEKLREKLGILRNQLDALNSHSCDLLRAKFPELLSAIEDKIDAEIDKAASDASRQWSLITLRRALASL